MGFPWPFRRRPASVREPAVRVVEARPIEEFVDEPVLEIAGPPPVDVVRAMPDRVRAEDYMDPGEFERLGLTFEDVAARKDLDGEHHAFSEYLVRKGLVDRKICSIALKEQRITNERIGAILVRGNFIRHDALVNALLEFSQEAIATEKVASSRIPVEILRARSIIISAETKDAIFVGSLSSDWEVEALIAEYYPEKAYRPVAFYPDHFEDFLVRMARSAENDESGIRANLADHEKLDRLLAKAMAFGASDIHIEPRGSSYSVLFRILGVRRHVHEGDMEEYNVIVSQIKDRSRMDIAQRRVGQDGGFKMEYSGKFIDLRTVTVASVDGEQVVVRILDPDRVDPKLENLGISDLVQWRKAINRKNGIALICGETGSGKTTTLMSSIKEFDRIGKKVYSAEDPVEYRIAFTGQVAVNEQVGMGWDRVLKNFMRADPDVIILGEVRDAETARTAIKAAETGHLVIATLHTGSIVSAVSRLRDLGVSPHELRYILRGVLVQTLVRCICRRCQGAGSIRGMTCTACDGDGYDRRTIVSECVSFSRPGDVDKVIAMGDKDTSRSDGREVFQPFWREMLEDGIAKMEAGDVSFEEMNRVFGSLFEEAVADRSIDPDRYSIAADDYRAA